MISGSRWLIGAVMAAAAAPSLSQAAPEAAAGASSDAPPAAVDCSAREFETIAEVTVAGERRGKRVRICGEPGQSDADWVRTLEDAIEKLEAGTDLPVETRDQIIGAIRAEIAGFQPESVAPAPMPAPVGVAISAAPADLMTGETSAPGPAWAPAPVEAAADPAPPPPVPSNAKPTSAAAVPAPALSKPRLTIRCIMPGDHGAGSPCVSLHRDTVLAVSADEDLSGGAGLRFLRRGSIRGEVALAQMRSGQTRRLRLPPGVCGGVLRSNIEIQVIGRGAAGATAVADTLGPYQLRC